MLWDELKKYLVDEIQTSELINLLSKSAINLISIQNTDWQYIAGRFAAVDLWKQATRNRSYPIGATYSPSSYLHLFESYIEQ
jgi:hypothetical protein